MNRSKLVLSTLALAFLVGGTAASAQSTELDTACLVALDACSANCNDLAEPGLSRSCLSRCDAAATTCFGDPAPTLSSERYLAHWGDALVLTKSAPACNDTTPCPAEYGSCGSWSGFYDCGDPYCGVSSLCKICDEWGQCTAGGPATKQNRERYRVCFNQQMQSCTEYQRGIQTLGCGC